MAPSRGTTKNFDVSRSSWNSAQYTRTMNRQVPDKCKSISNNLNNKLEQCSIYKNYESAGPWKIQINIKQIEQYQARAVLNIQELWIDRSLINANQYKTIWTISSWNYESTGSWSVIDKEYYRDFCPFFYQINKEDQQSVIAKMVKDIMLLRNAKPPRPPAPRRRKGWTGDLHAAHPIRLLAGPSGI